MGILKIFIAGQFLFLSSLATAGEVDLKRSKISWEGTKVVGSSHVGHIKIKNANIDFSQGEPSKANIVVDMRSISNTDLEDPKWNAKLVGHLNSEDFFDTGKYPTATLDVEKFQKVNDKIYQLHGSLEIKGQKLPVKLKAEIAAEDKSSKTVAVSFSFDRTKYGIRYGSGSFFTDLGDKMISDEVSVKVELNVKRSKQFAAN